MFSVVTYGNWAWRFGLGADEWVGGNPPPTPPPLFVGLWASPIRKWGRFQYLEMLKNQEFSGLGHFARRNKKTRGSKNVRDTFPVISVTSILSQLPYTAKTKNWGQNKKNTQDYRIPIGPKRGSRLDSQKRSCFQALDRGCTRAADPRHPNNWGGLRNRERLVTGIMGTPILFPNCGGLKENMNS